ncbi:MAG TPA: Rrf2 family transcriptional regulator [Syntrophorhabdales bacterium]|nr:Rrf2 family transcriptional regulator [Syntrophorhabdales bacterium]
MLKITADTDCGVMALFDIAYHSGGSLTQTKEIAARQGLSEGHIEQVFQRLKRARLVRSLRGPAGGYHLARADVEITIGDVVRAVDGPVRLVVCLRDDCKPGKRCERIDSCVTRGVWQAASNILMEVFDSVTLADLCERARAFGIERAIDRALLYVI